MRSLCAMHDNFQNNLILKDTNVQGSEEYMNNLI